MNREKPEVVRLTGWKRTAEGGAGLEGCSLLVPTYRRPREIVELMKVIAGLPDSPAEVVIVDGSPDDATATALHAWASDAKLPFTLVFVRSPAGLTRQRNAAIDASSGRYLFFLDDDCLPQPGYFRKLRDVFENDPTGRVGAACGTLVNEMQGRLTWRWRIRFMLGIVPQGEPGVCYPTATSVPRFLAREFTGTKPIEILPGCSMAFRREALEQNRFSSFFYGYSQGEDLEMSLRVGRHWRLVWCGDAHAIHNHAPGGRPASFQKGKMEVRNRYFIWKRHFPNARWVDRLRFWADIGLVFVFGLAACVTRGFRPWFLAHACGVAWGSLLCFVNPPRHDEPAPGREFTFDLQGFSRA